MDYATLSLSEIASGFEAVAQEAQATFGGCDARQLNWRPDAARWSVAQCFDHLLTANRLMFEAAERALTDSAPRTIWQRLPLVPAMMGRFMVRSLAPGAGRKLTAPSRAQPAAR